MKMKRESLALLPNLNLVLVVALLVALAVPFVGILSVLAAPTLQVENSGTPADYVSVYGTTWVAQTFKTLDLPINVTSIKFLGRRVTGSPGDVTISIRAQSGNLPTGGDLCYGTVDGTEWNTGATLRTFPMTSPSTILQPNTSYAIVLRSPGGDGSNYIQTMYLEAGDRYDDGIKSISTYSGINWTADGSVHQDYPFEIWGEYPVTYPYGLTDGVTGVTNTSATLGGNLTQVGNGSAWTHCQFEYESKQGNWEYTTAAVNLTSPGTWQTEISSLIPGKLYNWKIKLENEAGNLYTSNPASFYTQPFPATVFEDSKVSHQGLVTHAYQRNAFYAAGRHWIVTLGYTAAAMKFYWTSSLDGETWDTPYEFHSAEAISESDELNVYFDGTYLHCIYIYNRNYEAAGDNDVQYRRGIPQASGNITWSTDDWVIAVPEAAGGVRGYPTIVTDTDGYVWINYWFDEDGAPVGSGCDGHWVVKNSALNGTWTSAEGYPLQVPGTGSDDFCGSLVQLPSGKLFLLTTPHAFTKGVHVYAYDGSSWSDTETALGSVGGYRWSAVSWGDHVHVVQIVGDTSLNYYYYNGSSWAGEPITLTTGLNSHDTGVITVNGATEDLYVFWTDHAYDQVCYKRCIDNVWDEAATNWTDESAYKLAEDTWGGGLSTHIGSYSKVGAGKIAVYYVTWSLLGGHAAQDEGEECDVRFNFLEVQAGPGVGTGEATSVVYTSATVGGTLIDDGGETCFGRFQWGTTVDYGTNTTWQDDLWAEDTFSALIVGLDPDTLYHYRAQAKWADGTTSSGDDGTFTTDALSVPTVVADGVSNKGETSATLNGDITDIGGASVTTRGFEWDTNSGVPYANNWTQDGTYGTGKFSHGLTGLSINTTIYYRTMGYNSEGWGYSSEDEFDIVANPPPPPEGYYWLAQVAPFVWIGIIILMILGLVTSGTPLILVVLIGGLMALLGPVGTQLIIRAVENLR